jgi:hypothetical protein
MRDLATPFVSSEVEKRASTRWEPRFSTSLEANGEFMSPQTHHA